MLVGAVGQRVGQRVGRSNLRLRLFALLDRSCFVDTAESTDPDQVGSSLSAARVLHTLADVAGHTHRCRNRKLESGILAADLEYACMGLPGHMLAEVT